MVTKWTIGEKLDDKHFNGTFMFPDDLDFIGEVTNCQFFCDVFNDMVEKRSPNGKYMRSCILKGACRYVHC